MPCKYLILSAVLLLAFSGDVHAQQIPDDTKARLDAQEREIQELKAKINALPPSAVPVPKRDDLPVTGSLDGYPRGMGGLAPAAAGTVIQAQDRTVIPEDLPEPKSNLPFAIGYDPLKGLYIDAIHNPDFPKTADGKFPFELDIRGRIQADYYYYKANDKTNHLTGINTGSDTAPDESLFEVKRMRLIFGGWMWDPDLRYQIQFDGNTRGLATETTRQNAFNNPVGNVNGGSNISNVDAGVRLLEAWTAYDFHGNADVNGYRPVLTAIIGKLKPMGSLEEYLTRLPTGSSSNSRWPAECSTRTRCVEQDCTTSQGTATSCAVSVPSFPPPSDCGSRRLDASACCAGFCAAFWKWSSVTCQ